MPDFTEGEEMAKRKTPTPRPSKDKRADLPLLRDDNLIMDI
jgi:hypothetical protein